MRRIGELAERDLEGGREAAWLHARLTAADLVPLGITVNCSPVLDLGFDGQTEAIGDRAFSADPAVVAALGRATIEGHLAGGVLPVIKHLPGHGRATVDSHADLPCVEAGRLELAAADWLPFKANVDVPLGITAHILFTDLDPSACATQSATIIGTIHPRGDRFQRRADERRSQHGGARRHSSASARLWRAGRAVIWRCIATAISRR